MSALDHAVVGLYVLGMLGIGLLVSRRIGSFRDWFVAANALTAPLLVCTLVSTYYGLDVLFGGSELAFQEGLVAWFAYTRPYYVVILIAALLIAPRLAGRDFLSLPEVAGRAFGDGTRAVVATASALYALPLLSIMGIGVLLDAVAGIPFVWGVILGAAVSVVYTILGGLMADALTDTVQFVLMCVTLGVATVLALDGIGGFDALERALPASYFVTTGTLPLWILLVYALSALSALVEPAFYQRIFAAVNYRAVLVAMLLGIVLWAAFDWVTTILGMAAAVTDPGAEPRYALVTLVMDVLPAGMRGLFVAGVLATAMSTIDSYLLIAAGNVTWDLYRPLRAPTMSDAVLLRMTRAMVVAAAAVATAFALFFRSMVSAWIFMATVLVAAALVPLTAAIFARRPQKSAAGFASALAGLAVAIGYFGVIQVFGAVDHEWGTRIWSVRLGDLALELWQDYALLFALPASAAAYVLGAVFGRRKV